ncbi:MAG TPA: response regulator, partial [candidate division Zixibacteria bacterium]|nr:response regulator [candidate division Zixibacteria bacterium]
MDARILVIDDEESMCRFMEIMLNREGYAVDTAASGRDGLALLRDRAYDLVIADLNMPEMSGLDVLREVRSFKADQDLIVMTAYATVETAVEAMKQGAVDYVTKPFKVDAIKLTIEKALSRKRLIDENRVLKEQLAEGASFANFIGVSEPVAQLK